MLPLTLLIHDVKKKTIAPMATMLLCMVG